MPFPFFVTSQPTSEEWPTSFLPVLKREAQHASIYTLATVTTQVGSFLVVPLFWRKLSLADYGIISLTEVIGTFMTLFVGISLDTSITRFYYEWPDALRKRLVGTLWVLNWLSCAVFGVFATVLIWLGSSFLFPDVAFYPYLFLGLILTTIRSLFVVPYATIRIVNSPRLYTTYSLVNFSVQMSLNILFVLVLDKHLYGYFTSSILGAGVVAALGGVIMLRFATPCIEKEGLRESLRFSLPSIPTSILSAITQVLDRFLLQQFASLEVLGVYAVSLKFTNLLVYLHNALKLSYVPFMVKSISDDCKSGVQMLMRVRLLYLFPLFVTGLTVAVFVRDFVQLSGRSEYSQVAAWVPWLVGPALISTLTIYLAPGLFLAKRTDLTWIPQNVQLSAVVVAGFALIPRFQLTGVVISRYFSTVSLFVVTLVISQRQYPIAAQWRRLGLMSSFLVIGGVLANIVVLESRLTGMLIRALIVAGAAVAVGGVAVGNTLGTRSALKRFVLTRVGL